jgi:hypothetical protein
MTPLRMATPYELSPAQSEIIEALCALAVVTRKHSIRGRITRLEVSEEVGFLFGLVPGAHVLIASAAGVIGVHCCCVPTSLWRSPSEDHMTITFTPTGSKPEFEDEEPTAAVARPSSPPSSPRLWSCMDCGRTYVGNDRAAARCEATSGREQCIPCTRST